MVLTTLSFFSQLMVMGVGSIATELKTWFLSFADRQMEWALFAIVRVVPGLA